MTAVQCGMELQCFIVIHDKVLIQKCEREGRFNYLPNYNYLFVGGGDVSGLESADNVIIARNLPDNIEHFPNLLSFTGWYAVSRNSLARTPFVALLEYDIEITKEFAEKTLCTLKETRAIVGYVSFALSHPMYMHATPWLIPAVRKMHGIDLPDLVEKHLAAGKADQWTRSTNAAMSAEDLHAFVDWFLPMTPMFRDDPIGAHVHERTFPIFCMINEMCNHLISGVLEHTQNRSHNIFALSREAAQLEDRRFRSRKAGDRGKSAG